MDEAWEIDNSEVRAIRTGDLNPQKIFCKSFSMSRDTQAALAFSTKAGNPSKLSSFSWKPASRLCSDSPKELCGTMDTVTPILAVLRSTSSVGKRVHRLLLTGKGTPEMASRTELFPED
ncbi:hypothetical protein RRF57_009029 [Xylaria bambusicola]|uniref:Uncharacterized protein n=1 Tax=Xylaria bambusicola TaxID=326684 RepID=A0AAN7UIV3_9PEZI